MDNTPSRGPNNLLTKTNSNSTKMTSEITAIKLAFKGKEV
jgi:hypothetical protein